MTAAVNLAHAVVLKAGNAFLVASSDGTLPLADDHPLGLYLDDCRFLSGYELRVAGAQPRLLVTSALTGADAVHELTNPELELPGGRRLALQTLQVRIDRTLEDQATMFDRVHVHLYGRDPVALDVEIALAADFRAMLALRGLAGVPETKVRTMYLEDGIRFVADGRDGVVRATTITAEPRPVSAEGGRLRFPVELEPGDAIDLLLTFDLHQDTIQPAQPRRDRRLRAVRNPDETVWSHDRTRIRTDDELFTRLFERSMLDLRTLRSTLDGQTYHAAGIPWFATLFGRDSLIAAIETLAFDPTMAEQTLRVFAQRLGRNVDPWRDEEPGKVLHELRVGEPAALGLTPLARYYGTVDATPLFVWLLAEHAEWTGTLELFHELRPAVEATLGWIDHYGDHDGDGLLDYRAGTPEGLRNQGWKDSDDGVIDGNGVPLEPPIALVEVHGYVARAKRSIARLFQRDGASERADRLVREAEDMERRLERFWIKERNFYGMAIGADGSTSTALASNQGHLLWAEALPADRGRAVRDALMQDAMFSGWGIRTLGRDEAGFNPVGYHLGTVWPHDSALIAAGLRSYGYDDEFRAVFEALIDAASHVDQFRLPELFAGFSRAQFETPVPYPVACHPQAWAAGAIPYLLTTGLGLRADGLERSLRVRRPSLPRWVNRVEVEGLRLAGSTVDLLFTRSVDGGVALTDARVDGDLEVVLEVAGAPRLPAPRGI
ncbi:MAG TPA: glycogen debranching N-terminal domain-containing protein [Solirubrobacter sp.]|nr:glycogen debranching N-terminal domain-containing protein [Solirubrobacter sp.]